MTIVLALNAGSTSLKYGLFRVDDHACHALGEGEAEGNDASGVWTWLDGREAPDVIAHRIVHGGPHVRRHVLIDDDILAQLHGAETLAPLHVPPALRVVEAARARFPQAPQVACLDTAFHADMPAVARTYPMPRSVRELGVERYGFHGLSCASIMRQLEPNAPDSLVIAHLGGGCSVTAVRGGKSVDTTMGLTASGGLMMASRTGDLDPGVLVYLLRAGGVDADAIEDLVNRHSGLLGVSGVSTDLRAVRQSQSDEARLAVHMFTVSVAKGVSAMMAALGGADLLVFTGGVGEHDAVLREDVTRSLAFAGLGSRCVVRVLPAREDEEMARIAYGLTAERGQG